MDQTNSKKIFLTELLNPQENNSTELITEESSKVKLKPPQLSDQWREKSCRYQMPVKELKNYLNKLREKEIREKYTQWK